MANHKSAEKRARQAEKRNQRNRNAKGVMKGVKKQFQLLLAENKIEEAKKLLPEVYSLIDKTEKKGVIHSNTASRYKSRLANKIKASA
ncbi:MAG: 30S ribosomal protein S20 [Thermoanaerobaculaceae bacterium]|nr:30S ribosomal protein S20 [Thermoanaerobaculaceae bacterium]